MNRAKTKPSASALLIAYNALMAIGAIDDSIHSQMWCFGRAQMIANDAMRQLNTDYTSDVQAALGIGREFSVRSKRRMRGRR